MKKEGKKTFQNINFELFFGLQSPAGIKTKVQPEHVASKKSTRPVPFLLYMKPVKVLSCANSILNQSLINQAQFGIIQPNSEPSDVPYSTNKKLVEYFILEARCHGWTLVFVEDRNKCLDFFKITVFTL